MYDSGKLLWILNSYTKNDNYYVIKHHLQIIPLKADERFIAGRLIAVLFQLKTRLTLGLDSGHGNCIRLVVKKIRRHQVPLKER
jgi:hypothetical protein